MDGAFFTPVCADAYDCDFCLPMPVLYISVGSKKLTIVNPVIFGMHANSTIAHGSHTADTKPAHDVVPQCAPAIALCGSNVFAMVCVVLILPFACV